MIPFCQWCGGTNQEAVRDGAARPVCSTCGRVTYLDPKLAVAVVIARDGHLLLGLRAPGSREAGRWSFPAGFVERGEVVEEAAIREAREETGLEIRLTGLLGLYSTPGEVVVLAVYAAEVIAGIEAAGDDLAELAWCHPADLPDLAFPHDRRIVADWAATRGKQ